MKKNLHFNRAHLDWAHFDVQYYGLSFKVMIHIFDSKTFV